MDSRLTGNGRDASVTQVSHLFRSRKCIVCWLPQISLSCQLWGFYTWKLDKSFPSGLEKFATCMDGKREEAKGDSRVNDEPLTSWRVVFTFFIAEMWSYSQTKFGDGGNEKELQKTWQKWLLRPHRLVGAHPGPTLLPKNCFGNFPQGQTFLSQSLLLS